MSPSKRVKSPHSPDSGLNLDRTGAPLALGPLGRAWAQLTHRITCSPSQPISREFRNQRLSKSRPADILIEPDPPDPKPRWPSLQAVPMSPFLRTISAALVSCSIVLLPSSCASSPKVGGLESQPIRMVMNDFRIDLEMTMVNDAWLQRQGFEGATANERKAAFFSVTRGKQGSTTKVLDNRQAALLVNHLREEFHFDDHAITGSSPHEGGYFTSTIEIAIDGQPKHFGFDKSLPAKVLGDLMETKKIFVAAYNQVYSLQSVEDAEGFKRELGRR